MTHINYPKYPACHKCNINMVESIYLKQTFVSGTPDFPSDTYASTFSAGGTGKLAEGFKCPSCGHSITKGKEE